MFSDLRPAFHQFLKGYTLGAKCLAKPIEKTHGFVYQRGQKYSIGCLFDGYERTPVKPETPAGISGQRDLPSPIDT